MKIVRLSKDSNLTRIEKVFNWYRFSGRGPAGTISSISSLPGKAVVVAADLAVVGDSADSFASKKATWLQVINSVIRAALDLVYAAISGTTALGLITTSATIDASVNTEQTFNITADVTLDITNLAGAHPAFKLMFELVTATTATVTITSTGNSVIFPTNQTQTLTGLSTGSYEIIPGYNKTEARVVIRVQQVA